METFAEDGSTNWAEALYTSSAPAHSWTREACTELFAAALDHAAADGEAVLAQFHVLHAAFVVCEVLCFPVQFLRHPGMLLSALVTS